MNIFVYNDYDDCSHYKCTYYIQYYFFFINSNDSLVSQNVHKMLKMILIKKNM